MVIWRSLRADQAWVTESRPIRLRYAATCVVCRVGLPAGTRGWWDSTARVVTCDACAHEWTTHAPTEPSEDDSRLTTELDRGSPGGSAAREYQGRHDTREAAVRAAHPRLGGLLLALTEDPNSTTAWAKGAEGERIVGARLASLESAGVISLHDRRIPGSTANIDHIAVGPSGVFVIDAKRYSGEVTRRTTGSFWRPGPHVLYVGRRDCRKLIEGMVRQVAVVEHALVGLDPLPPVRRMLCFVEAEWGWFAKPFVVGDVWIGWSRAMAEVVSAPGPFAPEQIELTAQRLARRLGSA